ncbi:MAG: tetratricopeptide repeat protein [Desulfosarcinaceae bacterium]
MDMDVLTSVSADTLFSLANNQANEMETLANQALTNGVDRYMDQDYKGAALEFKRALGLSPYSDYAVDATKYLAQSYLQLDDTDKAIGAYKQSLKMLPQRDDLHVALGNLYIAEERTGEAIASYEEAVRIYDDAVNRFSLGQAYLKAGRHDDAESQFREVIRKEPASTSGYFGLGQVYAAKGKHTEAIQEFERALQQDPEFWDAYAEMGFTYADAGETAKAEDIKDLLEFKDEGLADLLGSYINKTSKPQMLFAWSDTSFQYYLPANTPVSDLGGYLNAPDSSQSMTMVFQFSKSMDREEIENPLNWSIKRASGHGPGLDYNFGLPIPETEVRISPLPTDIYYDEKNFTATVRFTIRQNAYGTGTIDPSHIEFTYSGKDADGNAMDPKYDQFMGFSGHF